MILEKASAEPGLAPQRDAGGQLVLAGDATVDAVVDPRWIGSGRTVFDNKGNVVRQYEPYFSATIAYEAEAELRERGVTAVLHYDPLGRIERTDFPDGTLARIERTPWFERRFDGNDTVFEGRWHAERIALPGVDAEQLAQRRAASLTEAHADTPSIVHFDVLGRAVRAIEDAGALGSFETRLELDVVGNVRRVVDARGNVAEARSFGLLRQVLQTEAADVGWRRALFDAGGSVLRGWNARGFTTRIAYDVLRRATHRFVTPPVGAEMLVVRTVWGEALANAAEENLRTRPYRVYDGSGELTNVRHDFVGNLVAQQRRLARVFDATVDWSELGPDAAPEELAGLAEDALSSEVFEIAMRYDALGRVVSRTTPDQSETRMTYNAAGLLETVDVRVRGAEAATVIVGALEYDARGQRVRCEHGNGTVATYAYEPDTFRLSRMRLVRTSDAAVLQDLRYTYDPVGNIVQIRDGAQSDVVFANAVVSADQLFAYDAAYRLQSATGREMRSLSQPTDADVVFRSVPDHNDPDALRTYTEQYLWDEVGNLRSLQHVAGGGDGFTRQYVYAADGNRLLRTSAPGQSAEPFSHSYTHDVHGNMTSMPHLAAMDWDHADRLQHCDLGGGGQVWFVYDAGGERVRKVRVNAPGARITERIYLGGYELYRERAVGSEVVEHERQTLHVDDERGRVCLVETLVVDEGVEVEAPANVARYQHGNHLGSVALELDGAGRVISYEEFHPFGTTSYAANDTAIEVSAKRYRYIGKERDDETGLYHLGVRYYAGWLGRWTAADPSGLADGANRYAYCSGNPIALADRTGRAGLRLELATTYSEATNRRGEVTTSFSAEAKLEVFGFSFSVSAGGRHTQRPAALEGVRDSRGGGPPARPSSHAAEPTTDAWGLPRGFNPAATSAEAAKQQQLATLYEINETFAHPESSRPDAVPAGAEPILTPGGQILWRAPDAKTAGDLDNYHTSSGDVVSQSAHGLEPPDVDPYEVAAAGKAVVAGILRGGLRAAASGAKRGLVRGDRGVVLAKGRAAQGGDVSAAAELRVAKLLRNEGEDVHFVATTAEHKTPDFLVSGVATDVKRIAGLGRPAAKDLAKGVEQVGPGGQIIVVRPAGALQSLEQYRDFASRFTPKHPGVTFRVVDEADLPKLGFRGR